MRPGPRLIRFVLLLAAFSLLVAAMPILVWFLVAGAVGLAMIVLAEARILRRIEVVVERDKKVALFLDEGENVAMRISAKSARAVHAELRQTWPALVDPPASSATVLL